MPVFLDLDNTLVEMPRLTQSDTAALLASVASAIQDDAVGLTDGR